MKEREISLADLVIEILLHWRGIIILMVIGGVLLGAFSYMRSSQSARAQEAEAEALRNQLDNAQAVKENLESRLTKAQMNNVKYALYFEEMSRARAAYAEQSVLMQIDPANMQRADITFLVSADDMESVYSIERVYEDMAESAELIGLMAEEAGLPASAIDEIYTLERGYEGMMYGSDTFRISIIHDDEEMCRALGEKVIDYLENKQAELERSLGRHTITVLNQSVGTVGDAELLDRQKVQLNEIYSAQVLAENYKTYFSAEEQQYYDLLNSQEEMGGDSADAVDIAGIVNVTPARVSLKYVIAGMVLAAFAYAFVIFVRYVLNNKILITDSLQALYDIPQLGQIAEDTYGKKLFGAIDKWILALRYWDQRKFTPEEALNLATVAVKMAAGQNSLESLCFIGCGLKAQVLEICQKMQAALGDEKIEVHILDNVLYNAESMEKLGDMKAVVLVEKAGSTMYTEIAQELELLKRQDIRVLGGIVVSA